MVYPAANQPGGPRRAVAGKHNHLPWSDLTEGEGVYVCVYVCARARVSVCVCCSWTVAALNSTLANFCMTGADEDPVAGHRPLPVFRLSARAPN